GRVALLRPRIVGIHETFARRDHEPHAGERGDGMRARFGPQGVEHRVDGAFGNWQDGHSHPAVLLDPAWSIRRNEHRVHLRVLNFPIVTTLDSRITEQHHALPVAQSMLEPEPYRFDGIDAEMNLKLLGFFEPHELHAGEDPHRRTISLASFFHLA